MMPSPSLFFIPVACWVALPTCFLPIPFFIASKGLISATLKTYTLFDGISLKLFALYPSVFSCLLFQKACSYSLLQTTFSASALTRRPLYPLDICFLSYSHPVIFSLATLATSFLSKYSWPLNEVGFIYTCPLIRRYFSMENAIGLHGSLDPRMQGSHGYGGLTVLQAD